MKSSWKYKTLATSSEDELRALGANLRIARERRKMSVTDLAQRLKVDRRVIQKLEKGDPTVSLGALIQALDVLGLVRGFSRAIAPETDIEIAMLEARKYGKRSGKLKSGERIFSDRELDF